MTKTKTNNWERSLMDYSAPAGLDDAERAVDFLHWAAEKFPERTVSIAHIVRVALSLPTIPRGDSMRIEEFRKRRLTRVRQLLFERKQRMLYYVQGLGYRASTGTEDVITTGLEKKTKVVVSNIHAIEKIHTLINPAEIKNKEIKARYADLTDVHRRLMSPSIIGKLLPPGAKDPEKKGDPEKK